MPCRGVDHMDFSAEGRYLIASCEFSGSLVKVDVAKQSLIGEFKLPPGGGARACRRTSSSLPTAKSFTWRI